MFYWHVLRFCIPQIAKITYDKQCLGIGIFTMQGYERRNKESKNTFRRFNNRKGNVIVQNLERLQDVYYQETNGY